jgi:hypothetical protein
MSMGPSGEVVIAVGEGRRREDWADSGASERAEVSDELIRSPSCVLPGTARRRSLIRRALRRWLLARERAMRDVTVGSPRR